MSSFLQNAADPMVLAWTYQSLAHSTQLPSLHCVLSNQTHEGEGRVDVLDADWGWVGRGRGSIFVFLSSVVLWPFQTGWLSTQLSTANTEDSRRLAWPCPRVGLFNLVCSSEEIGRPTGNLCFLVQIPWPSERV